MNGRAFMMTDLGIREVDPASPNWVCDTATPGAPHVGGGDPRKQPAQFDALVTHHASPSRPIAQVATSPVVRPGDVVRAAKERVKNLRTEIRRLKSLEKELAELERLIAAAKAKPVAIVRNIDHARQAR